MIFIFLLFFFSKKLFLNISKKKHKLKMSEGEIILDYIKKEQKRFQIKKNESDGKKFKASKKKIFLIIFLVITLSTIIYITNNKKKLRLKVEELKKEKNEIEKKIKVFQNEIKIFSPTIVPFKGEYDTESIIDNILFPFTSNIIKDLKDIEFMRQHLGKVGLRLEYQATTHGDNFETFIERTKIHHHHLVLIKTKTGKRFGGYISVNFNLQSLAGEYIEVGKIDNTAFLFNLDSQKIYDVNEDFSAVYCSEINVCQFGGLDLVIPNHFFNSKGKSEFPFHYGIGSEKLELTQGEKEFDIEELEAFHINFYPRDFYDDYEQKGRMGKEYNVFDY